MKRKNLLGVTAIALATAVIATGCSAGGQNAADTGDRAKLTESKVSLDTSGAESKGPAPEVQGARKGGTVNVLWRQDITHYDAAQVSASPDATVNEFIARRLTHYKVNGDKKILVGDLATNTGESTDGGKTWKFTLKDNIKYSDGTPIKAQDVKYAVARSFSPKYARGFTYIQSWLVDNDDYSKVYPGPYDGGELGNDKVETPDDKTIIFKFPKAQTDMPFAAALGTTVPVPQAKDTKEGLDQNPITSGPYKIGAHEVDKSLKLVKNEHWDASTDPVRHQYLDEYTFEFGVQVAQVTDRLTASAGNDKNSAALYQAIAPERLAQVMGDPKYKPQITDVPTAQVNVYSINTTRVTDLNVRKALLTAFPKEQARQQQGGPYFADFATTLGSPANLGWAKYDLAGITDADPRGDPEKAKKMLADAGKTGYSITLGYTQTPSSEKEALAVADGLEKAGFKVEKIPIQSKSYLEARDKVDNKMDLYWSAWAPDWPTASTVYKPLYHGNMIGDGRYNNSQFNDPAVNEAIDKALAISDPAKQGEEWMRIDKMIMEKVPQIPYVYPRRQLMVGANVGGGSADWHNVMNLANLYLKS